MLTTRGTSLPLLLSTNPFSSSFFFSLIYGYLSVRRRAASTFASSVSTTVAGSTVKLGFPGHRK